MRPKLVSLIPSTDAKNWNERLAPFGAPWDLVILPDDIAVMCAIAFSLIASCVTVSLGYDNSKHSSSLPDRVINILIVESGTLA